LKAGHKEEVENFKKILANK